MKHNCRWVLKPAEPGVPATYCEKEVSYRMEDDGEGNKHRKYDAFCLEHQAKAYAQMDDAHDQFLDATDCTTGNEVLKEKPQRDGVVDELVACVFDGCEKWSPLKIVDLIVRLDETPHVVSDMLEAFYDELKCAYPAIHEELYGDENSCDCSKPETSKQEEEAVDAAVDTFLATLHELTSDSKYERVLRGLLEGWKTRLG